MNPSRLPPVCRLVAVLATTALTGCLGNPFTMPTLQAAGGIDMPLNLDDPHATFGLSTATVEVDRFEAAFKGGKRRLSAVIPEGEDTKTTPRPAPADASKPLANDGPKGARSLAGITRLTAILPNVYTVAGDRLDAAADGVDRRVGVLAWRFDDWTDQLGDFQSPSGGLDARSARSRSEARAVGSSASDDPAGQVRFDTGNGPDWGRLGGYPQAWVATVYSVGTNGRVRGNGKAAGFQDASQLGGGKLVAWATFDRPFRTIIWGGQANVTPLTGQAAPPGRYALVLRPTSQLNTPPLELAPEPTAPISAL